MRQMPSVTDTTVPWLRMSALAPRPLDAALDQFGDFCGIELHDSLLFLVLARRGRRQAVQRDFCICSQAGLDRGVEHFVADHHAHAADQRRVDCTGRIELAAEALFQRPRPASATCAASIGNAL